MSERVDLEALERLIAAATPGPWSARLNRTETAFNIRGDGLHLCLMSWHSRSRADYPLRAESEANASLISAAPTAIAELIAELRRLRGIEADAARYRYLRDTCVREWISDMPRDRGAPSLSIDFEADTHDLDAALDAARAVHPSAETLTLSEQNTGGRKP